MVRISPSREVSTDAGSTHAPTAIVWATSTVVVNDQFTLRSLGGRRLRLDGVASSYQLASNSRLDDPGSLRTMSRCRWLVILITQSHGTRNSRPRRILRWCPSH